ncbi:MAG: ABC transporter permease, partial [Candidatus Micrarchaeia archaeon]
SVIERLFGYIHLTASHLGFSKKRTFLTLIGLTIGITALVSLISLGNGLQATVNKQFESLGTNKFIVAPGGSFGPGEGTASGLTEADLDAVRKARGVKEATAVMSKTSSVSFGSQLSAYVFVGGIETTAASREIFLQTATYRVEQGRLFTIGERGKAMIGWGLANGKYTFEGKNISIGQTLEIDGRSFRIIGSFAPQGNPIDDSLVYISLEDAKEVFNTDRFETIIALADEGVSPEDAADAAAKKLRTLHNVKKGEEDFTVQTPGQLAETFNSILNVVVAVVAGIAIISLLVGGVGIMNTMYTSVLERTTEIGIMKAVGATKTDILSIFLLESGTLGLVGGVLGVLIGMAIAKLVEIVALANGIPNFYANFTVELIGGALAFAFVLGTISGVLPARNAANLAPIDAIRGN